MTKIQRPRVAAIGLDDSQIEAIRPLCGTLRATTSLKEYLRGNSWTETDILVAKSLQGTGLREYVHVLTMRPTALAWRAGHMQHPDHRQLSLEVDHTNTERELTVPTDCPARYEILASGLRRELEDSPEPPLTFTYSAPSANSRVALVETTSGRRVAARLALSQVLDTAVGEQVESIVLVLPDVPNLSAWFRAFLADIHEHDPDRVPQPPPGLGSPSDWYTTAERALEARIRAIGGEIQQLEDERVQLESDLAAEGEKADTGIRRAIWAEGGDLVEAVSEILQELGFSVQDMDACAIENEPKHEDLRLTHTGHPDWEAIVEVKAYANGIRTNDGRQIREHRDHYLKEKGRAPELTLWLANPFRQMEPSSRPAPGKSVNDAAPMVETVCALTKDLYRQWVLVTRDDLEANDVVQNLVSATPGLWVPMHSGPTP